VRVPGVDKRCLCSWPAQTVHHILLFCPTHTDLRALYFQRARLADLHSALFMKASAHQVAQWLTTSGLLGQFSLVWEIAQKDTLSYNSLVHLNNWTMIQWTRVGSTNQTRFNEPGSSRNQERSPADQWKQMFKRQTAYRPLMHSEGNSNMPVPCWRSACRAELRFSIWVFPLQRRFALIDLDRDWIES